MDLERERVGGRENRVGKGRVGESNGFFVERWVEMLGKDSSKIRRLKG